MTAFQYCCCCHPIPYTDTANKHRCGVCWLIIQPRHPVMHTPFINTLLWIRHSLRLGMDCERISRDLGVSVGLVRYVIGD